MQNKHTKRRQAVARVEQWRRLSIAQQIDSLDRRLGKGPGARKQRTKLARGE